MLLDFFLTLTCIARPVELSCLILRARRAKELGDCSKQSVCPCMSESVVMPFDCGIDQGRWENNLCVSVFVVCFWTAIAKGPVGTACSVLNDCIILLSLLQLWKGNREVWKICWMIDE